MSTLDRFLATASERSGVPVESLSGKAAIDQDVGTAGDDVADFVEALALEFGEQVWSWPWQRFAQLDEGLSPLWPIVIVWQLLTWLFRGTFSYPSPHRRLEIGYIAAVIDRGK